MSVIRRPDVLGSRAQRRVDGLAGALSAAAVETLAVGLWFTLVLVETRTAFTALAGLGVLMFGALLRTGFFGSTVGSVATLTPWRRVTAAVVFAGSWLTWVLIAEAIGGLRGLFVAATVLTGLLTIQFWLERRAVRLYPAPPPSALVSAPELRTSIFPAVSLAIGATALLSTIWLGNWSALSLVVPVGTRTLVVEFSSLVLGLLAFGLCSFLAQERRFEWMLTA